MVTLCSVPNNPSLFHRSHRKGDQDDDDANDDDDDDDDEDDDKDPEDDKMKIKICASVAGPTVN